MRAVLTRLHRWAGLVMAGFLLVAGLTGSLLAWTDELEALLLPSMFSVPAAATASAPLIPLDSLQLREQLAARYTDAHVFYAPLSASPGRPLVFYLRPQGAAALPYDEVFVDPYSGAVLGERKWGDISQGVKNLLPFIERLHHSLALGDTGLLVFGIIAILWTIDCFIGAALTLPARPAKRHGTGKPWLARWRPAWLLRVHGGSYKLLYDLHRAGGLWLWAMLLVLAWSSVSFNLFGVYAAVMQPVFRHQPAEEVLAQHTPAPLPHMSWQQGRSAARAHMAALARQQGFTVIEETALSYDGRMGVYRYRVRSTRDVREHKGLTTVVIDAASGRLLLSWIPTGAASGDTIRSWLAALHMGSMWGWPFKTFLSLVGLMVAMLSVTGVLVWRRKRRGRR